MSTHDQFVIDENTTVIVEFPPEEGGFTEVSLSPAEIAQKSAEALSKAMDTIHHMARRVSAMVEQLPDPPTQIEAEFGIKWLFRTCRGRNQDLPHQEDLEEFFPCSAQVDYRSLSVHGFLMR